MAVGSRPPRGLALQRPGATCRNPRPGQSSPTRPTASALSGRAGFQPGRDTATQQTEQIAPAQASATPESKSHTASNQIVLSSLYSYAWQKQGGAQQRGPYCKQRTDALALDRMSVARRRIDIRLRA